VRILVPNNERRQVRLLVRVVKPFLLLLLTLDLRDEL
jgi:hypothetical protein